LTYYNILFKKINILMEGGEKVDPSGTNIELIGPSKNPNAKGKMVWSVCDNNTFEIDE
jgi:hypothetical protein